MQTCNTFWGMHNEWAIEKKKKTLSIIINNTCLHSFSLYTIYDESGALQFCCHGNKCNIIKKVYYSLGYSYAIYNLVFQLIFLLRPVVQNYIKTSFIYMVCFRELDGEGDAF